MAPVDAWMSSVPATGLRCFDRLSNQPSVGEPVEPADIAVKLAKTLNVTVEYLVNGNNNDVEPKKQDGLIEKPKKQDALTRVNPKFQSLLQKIQELDEKKQKPCSEPSSFLSVN
jgi:hypothetical protein